MTLQSFAVARVSPASNSVAVPCAMPERLVLIDVAVYAEVLLRHSQQLSIGILVDIMTGYARYFSSIEGKLFDVQRRNDIHFMLIRPFSVLVAVDAELCHRFFQEGSSFRHLVREVTALTVSFDLRQRKLPLLIIDCCFCPTDRYCYQEQCHSHQQKTSHLYWPPL